MILPGRADIWETCFAWVCN